MYDRWRVGGWSLVAMPAIGARRGWAASLLAGQGRRRRGGAAGRRRPASRRWRGRRRDAGRLLQRLPGKQWNSETRTWRHYSLTADAEEWETADKEVQKQVEEKKKRAKIRKEMEDGVSDTAFSTRSAWRRTRRVPSNAPT